MDLPFVHSLTPASAASLADWRDGDAWLAGGTALFSEPAPDLRRLHDLRAFGWPALSVSSDGLEIAATCTVAQLHDYTAPAHWSAAPLFKLCPEALYASWKVWQEATVGGNLCLALAAGAMTGMTAALAGRCEIWSPGGASRHVPVTELVIGPGTTSLAPGELLRSILIGPAALTSEVAIRQVSLSPRGRSAALVIGRRQLDGTTAIAITASLPRPHVLDFSEPPSPEALSAALAEAQLQYYDDVHGDPDWREHLTALLCEQVRAELESA